MSHSSTKKRGGLALLTISLIFLAFCAGFFMGRNTRMQTTLVSAIIPTAALEPSEQITSEPAASDAGTTPYPVNINTATLDQLMLLPGIGEVLAQRILDYRNTHGDFDSVAELMNVSGIGENRLEQLLPYATTGD